MRVVYSFMAGIVCGLVLVMTAVAVEQVTSPIFIEADRMEGDQRHEVVRFVGNVEARQDDLLIEAAEMTVYYQPREGEAAATAESQQIRKLQAKGNVKLSREGWIATGDFIDFSATERSVLLTGNTKVWQDNNMVSGERIILYLDEGKSVVERGSQEGERVKAFFFPEAGKGGK